MTLLNNLKIYLKVLNWFSLTEGNCNEGPRILRENSIFKILKLAQTTLVLTDRRNCNTERSNNFRGKLYIQNFKIGQTKHCPILLKGNLKLLNICLFVCLFFKSSKFCFLAYQISFLCFLLSSFHFLLAFLFLPGIQNFILPGYCHFYAFMCLFFVFIVYIYIYI